MGGGGNSPSFGPNAPCDVLAPATCDPTFFLTSPLEIEGSGYGAQAEAFIGFHPMENLTFRVGGRAWYLQGQVDASFNTATVTDPIDTDGNGSLDGAPSVSQQGYVSTSNPFSLFRYGLLAELTYKF